MKLRNALLAATVLGAPLAAPVLAMAAPPIEGVYVDVMGGANYLQDQTIKGAPGHISTDTGPMGSAAVGYGLGNGLRIELQGDFRTNKLYHFGTERGGGNEQQFGGFVNALYDFDLTNLGVPNVTPYLGVGVGYEQTKMQNVRGYAPNYYIRSTGTDGNFAVQGIAGVAFNIPAVPGLALTAEYRFMTTPEDEKFKYQVFTPGVISGGKFTGQDRYNHAGLVGIRYAFNQAPPPPPPAPAPVAAPAPAPARTYLVFFDWDRSDLTQRARQIIGEAAQASTRVQTTRINVNGYTDLSGTARYNLGLSVRRARSVQAELIRDGVPANEIIIRGYGEADPLVPTAQGVREPQNRRVEIILH